MITSTVALHAPLPMEFSREEYWSGLPCPSPGGLPDPAIEPIKTQTLCLLHWQMGSLPLSYQGRPGLCYIHPQTISWLWAGWIGVSERGYRHWYAKVQTVLRTAGIERGKVTFKRTLKWIVVELEPIPSSLKKSNRVWMASKTENKSIKVRKMELVICGKGQ